MNDRIRELAVEACKPNAVFKKYINGIDCGMLMRDEELERFAELIVRECGEIAYKTYWNNPLEVRGVHFKEAMYKRFGIGYE
jgi:hypothetical protein